MNKKSPPRGARIAFPFILVGAVGLSVAVLIPGIRQLHARQTQIEAVGAEKKAAEEAVLRLQREIGESDSDAWIERVARDELHWARPGETVFVFDEEPDTAGHAESQPPGQRSP
jgi:cell division protein FtsB